MHTTKFCLMQNPGLLSDYTEAVVSYSIETLLAVRSELAWHACCMSMGDAGKGDPAARDMMGDV